MKKKRQADPSILSGPAPWAAFGASIVAWGLGYYLRSQGGALTWMVFGKGALLLALSALVYALAFRRAGLWTFCIPMVWLGSSRVLWNITMIPGDQFYFWILLFFTALILTLAINDGRILLAALIPIWGLSIWLLKISFLLPLSFFQKPPKETTFGPWLRWGAVAAALGLFLWFEGRYFQMWDFEDAWDLWIGQRMGIFLLLGFLGAGDRVIGSFRYCRPTLALLAAGAWVFGGRGTIGLGEADLLSYTAVFFAGFGLETIRQDLLGDEWFHRALGHALGLAFLGALL